jgi:putative NADH-flavin reductase
MILRLRSKNIINTPQISPITRADRKLAYMIKIVVIGANGGIGSKVVELGLSKGFHITAIVRNRAKLTVTHPNLEIVQCDILKEGGLNTILSGKDAIVSAIGSSSLKETELYSKGAKNIIASMQNDHVKRALFISASGLDVNPTHSFLIRFATKQILQRVLRNMYADLVRMEDLIKKSNIDWTIIRPPRLTDQVVTGKYREAVNKILNNPKTISRANVAHYIINNLFDTRIVKSTVEIAD